MGVLRAGHLVPLLTQEQALVSIEAARQGGVWLSDGKRIWKFREGGTEELLGRVPAGDVKVMHEDHRGWLWVATPTRRVPRPPRCSSTMVGVSG